MPSHRHRIHRSRRSKKPIIIAGLLVAIIVVAIVIAFYSTTPPPAGYTLTIYTEGTGSVTPGNGTYAPGTVVDIKAAANVANWSFYGWSGAVSGKDNTSITMNSSKVVAATFIEHGNSVLLVTSMGNVTIQLRDDMPITTGNFKNLTQLGIYDDTIFHRVRAGFVIQGGDPTGTGYGDPSISSIQDEFTSNNLNLRGTIAMANKGANFPNSGSSQFFINLEYNSELDTLHPVFGKVVAGMDVVQAISAVAVEKNPIGGEVSKPVEDVILIKAILL